LIGKIIKIISNTYVIKSKTQEYQGTARGKFKIEEIKPVVRR